MSDSLHSLSPSMESLQSADRPIVLPALLLCDFGHLNDEVKRLEAAGAKAMHLDLSLIHI